MTAQAALRAPAHLADAPLRLEPLRTADLPSVAALVADAFGPGRFAKTAERVREGAWARPDLSVCAFQGEALAGAVLLWSVRVGGAAALFLGPISVAADRRRRGIAAALVERACAAAVGAGETAVVLVGDLERFGAMGFQPVPAGRVALPGPVDPARLLWRGLVPGALDTLAGTLR